MAEGDPRHSARAPGHLPQHAATQQRGFARSVAYHRRTIGRQSCCPGIRPEDRNEHQPEEFTALLGVLVPGGLVALAVDLEFP